MLFRQQALASENSANITPKQTEKVEASAEIAESSASTKNCPSTSAGVPSQCDDTHSNHDSSDDNQSSDGSQSTQDTCLVPDLTSDCLCHQNMNVDTTGCTTVQQRGAIVVKYVSLFLFLL